MLSLVDPSRAIRSDSRWVIFLLHIHVIPADSPEVEEVGFFRACLRADAKLLKLYVARKRKIITSGVADSPNYGDATGEFIKEVLG